VATPLGDINRSSAQNYRRQLGSILAYECAIKNGLQHGFVIFVDEG